MAGAFLQRSNPSPTRLGRGTFRSLTAPCTSTTWTSSRGGWSGRRSGDL